jgi:hypothetical protein
VTATKTAIDLILRFIASSFAKVVSRHLNCRQVYSWLRTEDPLGYSATFDMPLKR